MENDALLGLDARGCGLSEHLSRDIDLLDRLLGEVLRQQEGDELVGLARALFASGDACGPAELLGQMEELERIDVVHRLLKAFTTLFQLLNTAEQKEIVRVNRERQTRRGGLPRAESIREAVLRLRDSGVTAEQMQGLLNTIDVCPTLTAHPTEARRRVVVRKLHTVARWLAEGDIPSGTARIDMPLNTADQPERELRRALTSLWQTDELRAAQMTVTDEVRNVAFFLKNTVLEIAAWLHHDIERALRIAYPEAAFEAPALLKYRSWVGGDRDGNPNVTPETTWATLVFNKRTILEHYADMLMSLHSDFSVSARMVPPSEELTRSLERDAAEISLPIDQLRQHALEPYALKLLYIEARLHASIAHLDALSDLRVEGPNFVTRPPAYARSTELLEDLELVRQSLRACKAELLADEGEIADLTLQVRTAGFHLASLDIRQHSAEHERLLETMLHEARALPMETPYASLTEDQKVALLTAELCTPRPLLSREWTGSPEDQNVFQVFEVIRHAQRYISPNSVTAYVISMTHGVSDILEVLLLAKEAGLARWRMEPGEARLESDIDVVPLFETIDDLRTCHELMASLFENRAYRAHLAAREQFQEVMLGYSDSSKDGGYLAANWALQETQSRLAETCRGAGVTLRIFHGRGGTVGRGGGRANNAILSQPAGSFNGRIRFTEQGEVISFRYSLAPIAHRHIEQIVNAVMLATVGVTPGRRPDSEWGAAMGAISERSREAYRELVYDDPEFWDFYRQATPVQYVSRLPITSRPAFRPGAGPVGLEGLRAIPWVFAWVQSRYTVPGWYGVGTALEWFSGRADGGLAELQAMYREWPFFRTVIDNAELELLRAHMVTAGWYASRVEPAELGQRIHARIVSEYERTKGWVLRVTGRSRLLEHSHVVRKTIELRNPIVAPLSKLQVALMTVRDRQLAVGEADPQLHDAILLSIAGLAAAMQSTG